MNSLTYEFFKKPITRHIIILFVIGIVWLTLLQLLHWLAYCNDIRVCRLILEYLALAFSPLTYYAQHLPTLPGIEILRQFYSWGMCC